MDYETARNIVTACEEASKALAAAEAAIGQMPAGDERSQHLRTLGMVIAELLALRGPAVAQYQDLDTFESPGDPDTQLNAEEMERVSRLTQQDLELIDEALLASTALYWRKVARVVGTAMIAEHKQFQGVPDRFYAQRVSALVQSGALEAKGNLDYMRFSEVRLSSGGQSAA